MDLFEFYRNLLFLVLTIYSSVMIASSIWQTSWLLTSGERTAAMTRKYLLVLLLRLQVGRFLFELFQIAALTAMLLGLLWLHRVYPLRPDGV